MIKVVRMKNGFFCDMCFAKPEYEIIGDSRDSSLSAFTLHLCTVHFNLLKSSLTDVLNNLSSMEVV